MEQEGAEDDRVGSTEPVSNDPPDMKTGIAKIFGRKPSQEMGNLVGRHPSNTPNSRPPITMGAKVDLKSESHFMV